MHCDPRCPPGFPRRSVYNEVTLTQLPPRFPPGFLRRSAYNEVTLQLFNISRVRRHRTGNSSMFVNGQAVGVGDAGVMLQPGDVVWFGNRCATGVHARVHAGTRGRGRRGWRYAAAGMRGLVERMRPDARAGAMRHKRMSCRCTRFPRRAFGRGLS